MPGPERSAKQRNPYLNRVMIRDASDFYGRRREVSKIFARIGASRPQSVAIVGERRIGKSSLLNHLCNPEVRRQHLDHPDAYTFVFIDLQEQRDIGIPAFFENLFRGIELALGRERPPGVPADYERARRALVRLQEEGRKIVLLFDEFDAITSNSNFPEEFFSFLRAVANKYDVAYVTTSGRDLQQLCHADRIADSPFFNIFSNMFLARFESEDALALIREPSAAAGIPLAAYATGIIDLAGLFPFFIQMACSVFFEQLAEGRDPERELVRAGFLEEAEPHFTYILDHFDDDQRRVLADLVENRPVPPSRSYMLTKLNRDGYLLEHDGRAQVFSSAFAAFIRERGVAPGGTASRPAIASEWPVLESLALEAKGANVAQDRQPSLVGRQIGACRIVSLIGAGGMGEVYRARDTRLERDVAVKVLPAALSTDPARLARFEREARMLAALNHPHIGAIYGLEELDGMRGLILELVEGSTLADRLAAGPLAPPEALMIARQIASALEAAHAKGIVHRDLKPANIKVTDGGLVKVLDFGLAKMWSGEAADVDRSRSPTLSGLETQPGMILGTAAYMSPEQARGKSLDKRTDIWSFGCVLFESLTGRAAFAGETISDTIAFILEREPDWGAVPVSTPVRVHDLLRRCLQKDPDRRLHDIADARIEIEETIAGPSDGGGLGALIAKLSRLVRGVAELKR